MGIAGSTELGSVDNLLALGEVANEFNIHYHVDAAFGGSFIFSDKYSLLLRGIELADTITVCGHKQLYTPMGMSVLLLKNPTDIQYTSTTADYQATKDSFDLGKISPEGSRPAAVLNLHANLNILGKSGYSKIADVNIKNSVFLSDLLKELECFELIKNPTLNIVNYRYVPRRLRKVAKNGRLTKEENYLIDEINSKIQKIQFYSAESFASKTRIPYRNYLEEIIVFRCVLSNPLTKKKDIIKGLLDQIEIASELDGVSNQIDVEHINKVSLQISRVTPLIGNPISNAKVYILNKEMNLLPIGAIGELYVGGDVVSRGYLNQPQLTNDRFIKNPFQTEDEKRKFKNAKLYKTGDLVRWTVDGDLEFIGRDDFQVKIRGMRIELGEIEEALSAHANIRKSVVLTRTQQAEDKEEFQQYLVAYYQSKHEIEEEVLKVHLRKFLTGYMIPSVFVWLENWPLNTNGKLDREALPIPVMLGSKNYVAPKTEFEENIQSLFSEVLNLPVEQISVSDDFFNLGGNSLLAIKLYHKLVNNFSDLSLSMSDFISSCNVLAISKRLVKETEPVLEGEKIEF